MFQMDARTKPIPFPTPAVLLLTKDFNDGRLITETPLAPPPSFASLGLDQDLETDSTDHSLMARVQEKQQLAVSSDSDRRDSLGSVTCVLVTINESGDLWWS